jgi:hypothetical protein
MPEWTPFHLDIFCLMNALAAQVLALWLALVPLFSQGIKRAARLPWAAFCIGMILMIPQRWRPLELALHTGLYDFLQALFALLISILLLLAVMGLLPLLRPSAIPKKPSE